jgi:hypothetical protein
MMRGTAAADERREHDARQSSLTLYTGTPVMPSWYTARWPHVESP